MADFPSDYSDLGSDRDIVSIPSELEDQELPSSVGKRKRDDPGPDGVIDMWLCARVRMAMFPMPLDHVAWGRLTHIFLEDGLEFNTELMEIQAVGCSTMPFWKALKEKHPHLKIVWCCPNVMGAGDVLDRALGTNPFWHSLGNICTITNADFLELNLESVPMKHACIPPGWDSRLIVVLPNAMERLSNGWEWTCVERVLRSVVKAVVNSFGFLQKERAFTQHGHVDLVKILPECGLIPFHQVLDKLAHHEKILMGIDTQAVRYLLDKNDSKYFCRFELLSRYKLLAEKATGYRHAEDTEKRLFKYKSVYYPELQGTMLELRRKRVVVSYDSIPDINRKIDYLVSAGLGGVVIGCLGDDVDVENHQSILKLVETRLLAGQ